MGCQDDSPETLGQLKAWEEVKGHYLRLGLCHRCAAQAAYGHRYGFAEVEGPCYECRPLVGKFDLHAPYPWRKASRALRSGRSHPSSGFTRASGRSRSSDGTHGHHMT